MDECGTQPASLPWIEYEEIRVISVNDITMLAEYNR